MSKNCVQCRQEFVVDDRDRAFYEKVSPVFAGKKYLIPEPSSCPDCRQQRRLAFRNERSLYKRNDAMGKPVISIYSADKPIVIYDNSYWWSDSWNPMDYGRDFDFNRPFFEQMRELWLRVPMPARTTDEPTMQNSDYCAEAGLLKDCYLCFETGNSEKCLYSRGLMQCYDCVDCLNCFNCQSSYSLIESRGCVLSQYLSDCRDFHGWTEERKDGWTEERKNGWTDFLFHFISLPFKSITSRGLVKL